MKCMRCGTAITSDQVFCNPCLEDMKRHPVDPATPVQLPQRPSSAPTKSPHRKARKPEEQVNILRKMVFWQMIIIAILVIALIIAVVFLLQVYGVIVLPSPAQVLRRMIS